MLEQRYRWKNKQLREQVSVIDGKKAPTILLKNARYLNQTFRKWMTANMLETKCLLDSIIAK